MPTIRALATRYGLVVAYLMLAGVMVAGFAIIQSRDAQRCMEVAVTREALRANVRGTAALGRTLVRSNPDPSALTRLEPILVEYEATRLADLPPVECPA